MPITFKELALIAELHYEKLPGPFKQKASEFFHALDQDGNGQISLPELLDSDLACNFGDKFIKHVFYSLDQKRKGVLEFQECLTLYYLCMYSARMCAGCKKNIPHGLGYTCRTCWKERQPPNNEICVCLECFSSHNYQHEHGPPHLFHDFVLFDDLLHSRPASPPRAPVRIVEQTVKQCVICGDHHESKAGGFTCDVHMSPMRGSPEFVCEWCFSYLCSKCGNLFRDSSTRAEPGKWLQRFVCPACHERNVPSDCYEASLRRVQNRLSKAELLKQCKTCEIKQRNGTLFWYVKGTNTVSAAAPPSSQPSWQAPAPGPRPRADGVFEQGPPPRPRGTGPSVEHMQRPVLSRNSSSSSSSDGHSMHSSQDSGSSRTNPGGPNNRMNLHRRPRPQAAGGGGPMNQPNAYDVAAVAARQVNKLVNAAAANIFGGGGNGGNGGVGAGGDNPGFVDGGGGSGDGGGYDGGYADIGGALLGSLSNIVGGGQDGQDISVGILSSMGSLVVGD